MNKRMEDIKFKEKKEPEESELDKILHQISAFDAGTKEVKQQVVALAIRKVDMDINLTLSQSKRLKQSLKGM